MQTESKQRLRMNEWDGDNKNKGGINGEARCFVCIKEQSDDNSSLVPDFISLYLNSPVMKDEKSDENTSPIILKKNKDGKTKHAAAFHIKNLIKEIPDYNPGNLISPCKCEKVAHLSCLIRYCLMNICFRCNGCKSYYSVEFQEYHNRSKGRLCAICLALVVLFIFHVGLIALGVIFIGGWIGIDDKYQFWNYLVGGFFFLWTFGLLLPSICCLSRCCEKYKKKFPIFVSHPKGSQYEENENENDIIIDHSTLGKKSEMLIDMHNYLQFAHNSDSMDLIERKQNNMIFLETIIQDEMRVMSFIKENNNNSVFVSGKDMAKLQKQLKDDDDIENKFQGNVGIIQSSNAVQDKHLLRKQMTFTRNEDNSGGLHTYQQILVKSKTRNSGSKMMTEQTNKESMKNVYAVLPPRIKINEKAKEEKGKEKQKEKEKEEENERIIIIEENLKEEDPKIAASTKNLSRKISVEKAVLSIPKYKEISKVENLIESESNKMLTSPLNCYNCDVIIDDGNKDKP